MEWFKDYRPWQITAIEEIVEHYKNGIRLVILDAPTGTGKTLIGEGVRLMLDPLSSSYVCTTKSLQDQVSKDFPYAAILKGRSNYIPLNRSGGFGVTCADCTKRPKDDLSCMFCPSVRSCPYERAKATALGARLSVLNTSYLLTECNGPGRFSNRGFVIADEGDVLEKEVMSYAGLDITPRRVAELGIGTPAKITKQESWVAWIKEAREKVSEVVERCNPRPERIQDIRQLKYLSQLLVNLERLDEGIQSGNWVYTGKDEGVSFKPVVVSDVGDRLLWKHAEKWLVMSGTIISPEDIVESLGWNGDYETVKVDSQFKKENRPVKVKPIALMTKEGKENGSWEEMVKGVRTILANHPNERVLIHTVSYDLSSHLANGLNTGGQSRPIHIYTKASERDQTLAEFRRIPESILIASSMDRGIDLPDDLCRVIVICKVPYPYLGDRQVSARLHTKYGQLWYSVQTIRTLIQMCGRGVRHVDDYCVTYILDSSFINLYKKSSHLFPKWWKEALDTRGDGR